MQQGLSIGIGSWIDAQYQTGALPAFPSVAIPFKLHHIASVKTPEDLERVAEFSILSNKTDALDDIYGTGNGSPYLWFRHKTIISSMVHASITLSNAEKQALDQADKILFGEDGVSPSVAYQLYNESQRNYNDLVLQSADEIIIESAYNLWLVFGHKRKIEEAIATKLRLTQHVSSIVAAQSDFSKIDMALTSVGTSIEYVPTSFSPISATSVEHWLEAEVDFQALEDTIKPQISQTQWRSFRGNKSGKVRFKYIGIDIIRPWMNEAIYEADDWRLPVNDSELVSSGNGLFGKMPWIFSRIYMATILEIRNETVKIPDPVNSNSIKINPGRIYLKPQYMINRKNHRLSAFNKPVSLLSVADSKERPKSQGVKRLPLIPKRPALAAMPIKQNYLQAHKIKPVIVHGHLSRVIKINKIDAVAIQNKLNFAMEKLSPVDQSHHNTSHGSTTYIVGFGRKNLPLCPNSNPNYQWPEGE